MTDYTDPTTIDVDTVLGEINSAFNVRGHTWTDRLSWPNVTVKALADEIERLRARVALSNRFLNDVLGVARNVERNQLYATNLSYNSSVALPSEFNELWDIDQEEK